MNSFVYQNFLNETTHCGHRFRESLLDKKGELGYFVLRTYVNKHEVFRLSKGFISVGGRVLFHEG